MDRKIVEGLRDGTALGWIANRHFTHQFRVGQVGPFLRWFFDAETGQRIEIGQHSVATQHWPEPAALFVPIRLARVTLRDHRVGEPVRVQLEQAGVDDAPRVGLSDEVEGAAAKEHVDAATDL